MTWQHVLLIIAALAAPVICGVVGSCHDMLPAIKDLSLAVVSGTMGNAMRSLGAKESQAMAANLRKD